ncbi:MAG: hypothetical protein HQK84_12005, partial [Nitrospinae bacterium]|nr:hypothetical protein [Nitrospinota bacterium]
MTFLNKYKSYIIDFFIFVAILIFARFSLLQNFYAPFFLSESSEAFMQIHYYIEAIRNNSSLYWDHSINLATQGVPQSPLLSPITILILLITTIFSISDIETQANIFAFFSYFVQVMTGFTMYLLLRHLSLSRFSAIIGGIGYSYCIAVSILGIYHGYYRASAMMLFPLLAMMCIRLFNKEFSKESDTLFYTVSVGLLLGICLISNGDVKPTAAMIPVLVLMSYYFGIKNFGAL